MKRIVDLNGWAARGESLLDLRKNGPFKGQGALRDAAAELLLGAWERGSSGDVVSACGPSASSTRKGSETKHVSAQATSRSIGDGEWRFRTG